ncbi:NAD-dependent protein deacetylase HST1 [Mercurialis annua]|uniref:NAD-dependent protein deacetylase HST1 n=1 Tax=Mercurialis annua TaxID=3986 RepID=UPI00215E7A03|nr:NAD-dependent protein deacetylase HST1 [Mercurialis annua]
MGSSSRELLHLEHKNGSSLESTLLFCNKKDSASLPKKPPLDGKPLTTPIAQSQVLGKVRDFIGVISEANKQLQQDAKDKSQNFDIEVLTGNESDVIEMDLMLGVADLHTPEAIAAAESALSNGQATVTLDSDISETESGSSSDDDDDDEADSDNNSDDDDDKASSLEHKNSKFGKCRSSTDGKKNESKKRPKIVEM